ncbi:unnamed protein product, partial [Ixodes hexagonus]
ETPRDGAFDFSLSCPAMGNQPGGPRMDPSNPEPALPNRRKSSELRKERQEVPARAGRENIVLAQEVLSDVVNRAALLTSSGPPAIPNVDCDESVPAAMDLNDSTMNRTFTKEELEVLCSPEPCSPQPQETSHDADLDQGDSARGKPPASGGLNVTYVGPSELDCSYKTTVDTSLQELERTQFFDALNVTQTSGAELGEVKQPILPGTPPPFSGAPSEPPSERVDLLLDGFNVGSHEEFTSFRESPRVMDIDDTLVGQSSGSPLQLLSSPLLSRIESDVYDENVNLVRTDPSLVESPPRTVPQDCNDNELISGQASKGDAVAARGSFEAADRPLDLPSDNTSPLIQLVSTSPGQSPLATAQDCNDNILVAAGACNEDTATAHGSLQVTPQTLDNKGGTAAPALECSGGGLQVQPEVDVPPKAVESTEVCSAASELQPQDSEAGPEVAQFSEEEFFSVAANFKDPSDFDFLQKVGSSKHLKQTRLGRCSLYLKFDPLVSEPNSASQTHCKEEQEPREQHRCSTSSVGKLIDFADSPIKGCLFLLQEHMFSEKEMTQALKYQELMFQERLLKKDQDYMKEQERLREEAESWRGKFEHLGRLYEQKQNTLLMLKSHNEQIVSAIERHVLDKKKNADEKTASLTASLQKITKERDQLAEDLHNMEIAFADFHRRYEKAKQAISMMKENESILKQQLTQYREGVEKSNQMFNMLKAKTEESLEGATKEIEDSKKNFQADITVLRGQLKKAEMDNSCLEKRLEQKTEENAQLAKLYDDLLSQVKAK